MGRRPSLQGYLYRQQRLGRELSVRRALQKELDPAGYRYCCEAHEGRASRRRAHGVQKGSRASEKSARRSAAEEAPPRRTHSGFHKLSQLSTFRKNLYDSLLQLNIGKVQEDDDENDSDDENLDGSKKVERGVYSNPALFTLIDILSLLSLQRKWM